MKLYLTFSVILTSVIPSLTVDEVYFFIERSNVINKINFFFTERSNVINKLLDFE